LRARILFVDDHEDTRILVPVMLGAHGYDTVTAPSLREAYRLATSEEFDLFLLDFRYRDGTGKELCEKIREFDKETPVIFFSGSHPQVQQEALSCGAQGYVLKPDFDALRSEIRRVLRQKN
jgi:DNA-binding response OmpR family regulator